MPSIPNQDTSLHCLLGSPDMLPDGFDCAITRCMMNPLLAINTHSARVKGNGLPRCLKGTIIRGKIPLVTRDDGRDLCLPCKPSVTQLTRGKHITQSLPIREPIIQPQEGVFPIPNFHSETAPHKLPNLEKLPPIPGRFGWDWDGPKGSPP